MRQLVKISSLVFVLGICFKLEGQNPNEGFGPTIPQVLPPSPDASAIIRGGDMNVGLFNGAANASIPFYEMKVGGLSLPIGLSYSSSGLKLDEMPSVVGMNWVLSCSGVITRSLHDRPDDDDVTRPAPMSTGLTASQQRDYYNDLVDLADYDSEPDEFNVSAPGLQFKFIIDDAGDPVVFPYSKVLVEIHKSGTFFERFVITNTDGARYEFGKAYNVSGTAYELSNDRDQNSVNYGITRTAWYLRKITLTTGQYILFNYSGSTVSYSTSVAQSVMRGASATADACPCEAVTPCKSSTAQLADVVTTVTNVLNTRLSLTSIESSDGQVVSFDYEDVSISSDDQRISTITIEAGDVHKKYNLSYEMPETDLTKYPTTLLEDQDVYTEVKRFFLKEISWSALSAPSQIIGKYKMDYKDYNNIPRRLSFAQDLFGYYNGASNPTFFPTVVGEEQEYQYVGNNDRSSHPEYAMKGMLEKLTLPTGGYQKFYYQANTKPVWGEVYSAPTLSTATVSGAGAAPDPLTYESSEFTLLRDQNVEYTLDRTTNGSCSSNCTIPAHPGYTASLAIVNTATGLQEIYAVLMSSATSLPDPSSWDLPAGTYKLVLRVRYPGILATGTLSYDPALDPPYGTDWVEEDAAGIRVSRIESYDPITSTTSNRYFKYADHNLLSKSSGKSVATQPASEDGIYKIVCPEVINPGDPECSHGQQTDPILCPTKTLTTSSANALYRGSPYPIIYSSVIESNDPEFANGGIQHNFNTDVTEEVDVLKGSSIAGIPSNIISNLQGFETETIYFDNNMDVVRSDVHEFTKSPTTALEKSYTAHVYRKRYDPSIGFLTIDPLAPFDEISYVHRSSWFRSSENTSTETSSAGNMVSTQQFYYDETGAHTQVIKTETTDSKGNTLSTESTYPTDYGSSTVHTTMVGKNMLDFPIEVIQKQNTDQLTRTTNQYKDWFSDGSVIAPEIIKFQNGSYDEEPRVKFYQYDHEGNALKIAKQDDIFISYVWDYKKRYPVAEAKNTEGNIAYTSFESDTDDDDNWTGVSATHFVPSTNSVTGANYYSATSFSFSRPYGTDATYWYVTYWTGNSSAYSVSGTVSGWPKLLKTLVIGGKTWKLYQHKVTNSDPVTVSGTGDIDELRFYSEKAQMVTYTYAPFAGASSQCDINGNITYYEYDELGRLSHVRDEHKNILRKICYNYAGQPENCGVIIYKSVLKSGSFTKNNCSCGATGYSVTYSVAAEAYTSTLSQVAADQLAQDDVDANGQAYANASSAGTYCPAPGVYARIECTDIYHSGYYFYVTLKLRFYCDAACTTPIEVTNLDVNYHRTKTWCNDNQFTNNITVTCNGYETTIASNYISIAEGTNLSCYQWEWTVDTGTGYTPVNL